MIRRTPRSTLTDTLFPYTTLFRSAIVELFRLPREGVRVDPAGLGALCDRRIGHEVRLKLVIGGEARRPVTERLIADDPRAVIDLRSADAVELLLLVRPAQFGSDVERRGDLIAERSIDRPSSRHDPPAVGRKGAGVGYGHEIGR